MIIDAIYLYGITGGEWRWSGCVNYLLATTGFASSKLWVWRWFGRHQVSLWHKQIHRTIGEETIKEIVWKKSMYLCMQFALNIFTCVCSWSLRSSNTVSKSNEGKPLLRLRSERKLTARVVRLAIEMAMKSLHLVWIYAFFAKINTFTKHSGLHVWNKCFFK